MSDAHRVIGLVSADETDAFALRRFVRERPYEVRYWSTGQAFLDAARSPGGLEDLDVLVIDVRLPDVDGPQLILMTRAIGSLAPHPPILALSGIRLEPLVAAALTAGAEAAASKPNSVSEYRMLVQQIVSLMNDPRPT